MKLIVAIIICFALFAKCDNPVECNDIEVNMCIDDSIMYKYTKLLLISGASYNPLLGYLSDSSNLNCADIANVYSKLSNKEYLRHQQLNRIDEPNLQEVVSKNPYSGIYRLFITNPSLSQTVIYRVVAEHDVIYSIKKTVNSDSLPNLFTVSVDTTHLEIKDWDVINDKLIDSYYWLLNQHYMKEGNYSHGTIYTIECIKNEGEIMYNRISFEEPLRGEIELLVQAFLSMDHLKIE